ncbi:transcriptional regulator, TetR family [[Actinomadura] parvosata subsp. kistnae]|uniref:TetR family transcriptional regulator n=1 Tax=[Actinomadura] parvosata subsp. kistnae TaxID=1909395 RepID=A0A1V0A3W7_9ACTN|nr:TetR/AcrR family transcriptional regulator [Nonomuraea sp. ATCC 55076]AQZ64901.1 TetR family transcriptional regulator [Nonomuraea sp. ATCC 55076]SPL96124.1 transcriptional regulator, TetR family [Actinomadura parvosata subsp. kistnae]
MPERTVRRQARGLKRMADILDAAEQVIAEVGYPEMTTNQVAARAGMSPGSLYQFFRNKEEILDGLVTRYTDDRQAFWADRLAAVTPEVPLEALVGQLVDESVRFKTASPAYWSLLYGTATGDRLAAASQRLHEDIAGHIAAMLRRRSPTLSEERAQLTGTMALAMVKAVMPMISTSGPERAAELVTELKLMLVRYLS